VPVPHEEALDGEDLGSAAYLRITPGRTPAERLGALLCINVLGEPLEFVYNRIEIPHSFLWRSGDLERQAARRLTASLFMACNTVPRLLLCQADEIDERLFGEQVRVSVPVGRVAAAPPAPAEAAGPDRPQPSSAPAPVSWTPAAPSEGSPERQLFDRLATHGLLAEPFERAAVGLREVYPARPAAIE
jgi:hypothetical protein